MRYVLPIFIFLTPLVAFAAHDLMAQAQVVGADFAFPVASLITGFFATAVMTGSVILLHFVGKIGVSIPLMLGMMMLRKFPQPWQVRVGLMAHLALGSIFGLLFGYLLQNHYLFSQINGFSGILFGLLLWLFMMAVVLPAGRFGFFAMKVDHRLLIATFAGHVIYGLSFAYILPVIFLHQ